MRLAYLVSRYPAVTHTFVATEVRNLRAAGVEIDTVSIRRASRSEILTADDTREFERTHALLPTTVARLVRDHWRAFARSPAAYGATLLFALRITAGGGRALLWQLFYFAEAMMLWAWLEGRGLRHVHVHFPNVASDVAMLATRYGNLATRGDRFGWSLSLHGPTELFDIRAHKLARKVHEADLVVCTCGWVYAQVLAASDPADREKLRMIYCGIDLERFTRAATAPPQDGAVSILTVGALAVRKGHRFLLEALAMLRREGLDVHLTLAGDGPERTSLESQARALGLEEHVSFRGAVGHDAVADLYRRADIFCLPSFAEGLPTVIMEAMASGLPVVATHVMGVPELVDDTCGVLVPPARAEPLAAALARLAHDGELRSRMGHAGSARVSARHSAPDAAAFMRQAFETSPAAGR